MTDPSLPSQGPLRCCQGTHACEQKVLNRVRSRERIKVEHMIGQRKKYRIASLVYRNADADYDGAMNVVGGLVNLRAYDRIAHQTGIDLLKVCI